MSNRPPVAPHQSSPAQRHGLWQPSRRAVALSLLFLAALSLRLALLPLAEGYDFRAFARLIWLTLHGRDVYALSGTQLRTVPWAYLPLYLHVLTALGWLSAQTGWPFRVLGKLPVVAADLAIGWLLYRTLRRHGRAERVALGGAALYLFNPLVLYNGAFYGRFDAVPLAFLLLALEGYRTRLFAPAYALAIAAKTFPIFLLPLLALGRDRQSPRRLAAAGALALAFSLPDIVSDPLGLAHNLLYHTRNTALGWLSWYTVLRPWLSAPHILAMARLGGALYVVAQLALVRLPLYAKAAACFALFVALSPTVYEQYLLWPLPFLIVLALRERDRSALWLGGMLTVAGLLENEYTMSHPRLAPLPTPWPPLNVALALGALVFVAIQARRAHRDRARVSGA